MLRPLRSRPHHAWSMAREIGSRGGVMSLCARSVPLAADPLRLQRPQLHRADRAGAALPPDES